MNVPAPNIGAQQMGPKILKEEFLEYDYSCSDKTSVTYGGSDKNSLFAVTSYRFPLNLDGVKCTNAYERSIPLPQYDVRLFDLLALSMKPAAASRSVFDQLVAIATA
jgi:hypothetical protein